MAKTTKKKEGGVRTAALRFTTENAVLAAAGVVCLAVGYWLLARGSITAAPILLVLAYVVLLPLAIIR